MHRLLFLFFAHLWLVFTPLRSSPVNSDFFAPEPRPGALTVIEDGPLTDVLKILALPPVPNRVIGVPATQESHDGSFTIAPALREHPSTSLDTLTYCGINLFRRTVSEDIIRETMHDNGCMPEDAKRLALCQPYECFHEEAHRILQPGGALVIYPPLNLTGQTTLTAFDYLGRCLTSMAQIGKSPEQHTADIISAMSELMMVDAPWADMELSIYGLSIEVQPTIAYLQKRMTFSYKDGQMKACQENKNAVKDLLALSLEMPPYITLTFTKES